MNFRAFLLANALLLLAPGALGSALDALDLQTPEGAALAAQFRAARTAHEALAGDVAKGAATAEIRGRVTDSATGLPLEFVEIHAYRLPDFDQLFTAVTDANGEYGVTVPSGESYRVNFAAGDEMGELNGRYTREQYSADSDGVGIYCDVFDLCQPSVRTPVNVPATGVSGIDATLDPAGFIGGQLQDDLGVRLPDAGLAEHRVAIYDADGRFAAYAFQESFAPTYGIYLPPGQYYLFAETSSGLGYIDVAANGTLCPRTSCGVFTTVPFVIVNSQTTILDADFQLPQGGVLSGSVIERGTLSPVDALVFFYRSDGRYAGFAGRTGDELYSGATGLPDDTYYVSTQYLDSRTLRGVPPTSGQGIFERLDLFLVDPLYQDLSCPNGCDVTAGTGVTMTGGLPSVGSIDLLVDPGGTITGRIASAIDGAAVGGVAVAAYDGFGTFTARVKTSSDGSYRLGPLLPGAYFLVTEASDTGFVDQLFDATPCLGAQCEADVLTGTPVVVAVGAAQTGRDFNLRAEQILLPGDVAEMDQTGRAVAVCGNRVFIGVPGDDEAGTDAGAVLAYQREGSRYVLLRKLFADVPETGDRFGAALACDGDRLAVGAPGEGPAAKGLLAAGNRKAAYLFSALGTDTTLVQTLVAENLAGSAAGFGHSIAISGERMIVGAPESGTGGAAVVFSSAGDLFSQETILIDPEAEDGDGFGTAVGTSEGGVVVGAPNQRTGSGQLATGTVQLFTELGAGGFQSIGKFTGPDSAAGDAFGAAVGIDGMRMVVGAPGADLATVTDAGAAHVFAINGSDVTRTKLLTASDAVIAAGLGSSVAIADGRIVAGAPGTAGNVGAAYLFDRTSGDFAEINRLENRSGGADDGFGSAVALGPFSLAVGSPGAEDSAGIATVFTNADQLFEADFER